MFVHILLFALSSPLYVAGAAIGIYMNRVVPKLTMKRWLIGVSLFVLSNVGAWLCISLAGRYFWSGAWPWPRIAIEVTLIVISVCVGVVIGRYSCRRRKERLQRMAEAQGLPANLWTLMK